MGEKCFYLECVKRLCVICCDFSFYFLDSISLLIWFGRSICVFLLFFVSFLLHHIWRAFIVNVSSFHFHPLLLFLFSFFRIRLIAVNKHLALQLWADFFLKRIIYNLYLCITRTQTPIKHATHAIFWWYF